MEDHTDMKKETRYLLVNADICPDIFLKVVEAKKRLALYTGKSVTEVLHEVGLGKSAFYKYRDNVFQSDRTSHTNIVTLYFVVEDFSGILASIVNKIAAAKANILTINQNVPIGGLADVTITVDTDDMKRGMENLLADVCAVDGVRRAEVLTREN